MRFFRKIFTDNYELSKVQTNVDEAFTLVIQKNNILGGTLIPAVQYTTADRTINHGLGRPYQGYFVAGLSNSATIFISPTANLRPEDQIILRGSTTVTASIYVF